MLDHSINLARRLSARNEADLLRELIILIEFLNAVYVL